MADEPTIERRPIAARELRVSQAVAGWLCRCGISANAISVGGMVCGLAAGGALAATAWLTDWEQRLAWLAGALFIQLRLAANMFDGMVAIASGQVSPVGELYNEVPDRVSDTATLVGAGYAVGGDPLLGYLAALVAVFTAYIRAMGKGAGAPQEFCGPMAKQQRMFIVTVIAAWCGLTPRDWQWTWNEVGWGLPAAALLLIIVGGTLTTLRRLLRIARNLRKRDS